MKQKIKIDFLSVGQGATIVGLTEGQAFYETPSTIELWEDGEHPRHIKTWRKQRRTNELMYGIETELTISFHTFALGALTPELATEKIWINEWPLGRREIEVFEVERNEFSRLMQAKSGHPFVNGTGEGRYHDDLIWYNQRWVLLKGTQE